MKTLFLCKRVLAAVFLAASCASLRAAEQQTDFGGGKKLFKFSVLESGSWAQGGNLTNRLDLRLYAPLGLSFRAQAADKRPAPPWKNSGTEVTALGTALYHKGTGSRLLYGLVETSGLLNRTRNVWTRSAPWFEAHSLSTADLKTQAGDMEDASVYMELLSPPARLFNGGFSAQFDRGANAVYTAMAGVRLPYSSSLRLEGLTTGRRLDKRESGSWFSTKPPLPERELRFYALNAVFANPYVSFAGDFARSEIFAWGSDIYANAAIRAGARRWRISIAADGSGARFSSSDGSVPGAGFRTAAKFEWEGERNMLFRASSTLRAAAWKKPFDRSLSSFYFRFPQNKNRLVRINRVSMEIGRDAQKQKNITDSFGVETVFNAGIFRPAFSMNLGRHTVAKSGDYIYPFPDYTVKYQFDSLKLSASLSCVIYFVSLNGAINYSRDDGKEPLVATSAGASVSGNLGRLGLKLSNNAKTGDWTYTFSWRLQKTFG